MIKTKIKQKGIEGREVAAKKTTSFPVPVGERSESPQKNSKTAATGYTECVIEH